MTNAAYNTDVVQAENSLQWNEMSRALAFFEMAGKIEAREEGEVVCFVLDIV